VQEKRMKAVIILVFALVTIASGANSANEEWAESLVSSARPHSTSSPSLMGVGPNGENVECDAITTYQLAGAFSQQCNCSFDNIAACLACPVNGSACYAARDNLVLSCDNSTDYNVTLLLAALRPQKAACDNPSPNPPGVDCNAVNLNELQAACNCVALACLQPEVICHPTPACQAQGNKFIVCKDAPTVAPYFSFYKAAIDKCNATSSSSSTGPNAAFTTTSASPAAILIALVACWIATLL